jgi:hypothetical protein
MPPETEARLARALEALNADARADE